MKTGRLRHHITIQKAERRREPSGAVVTEWVNVTTVSAEVKAISGRELMASGMVMSEATVRIWLRYRADITTSHRVVYHKLNTVGDKFGIVAVIPDAKHTLLELLCKGGVFND
ncbi:phage head closure protein [Providencia rettgeri]|uniref:phage head closure protein n=1 Tax=Providencia rettgeri TaxID=587 RepID=UPI0019D47D69|nr:phage head closure protein [Providencia rettgeri]MBN7843657.1 phage head closure protein [Providencia rettgeri]MBN7852740.1 phage head closure protein [Providencia rettgeri]MBN7861537.1 phage head closure protein [Providencia rettgeri]MBN7871602.1 phage head closure protein [Providencia rettgeri]MBN7896834.1 phage head closure protein [Providencia rettgeri]